MNPRRVALVLAAAAAAVILLLRLFGADDSTAPTSAATSAAAPPAGSTAAAAQAGLAATTATSPAADPAVPDDIDDDSLNDPDPASGGTARVDTAGAADAAARFARDWTRHTGTDATSWAPRLAALSTPTLAGKLRGIDPAVVPADKVTAAPQVTATPGGADASITTDTGTLRLTLVHQGRWQVDTLDWSPAR